VTEVHESVSAPNGDERLLDDQSELLYRQVPPAWVDDGIPSSQAFAPTRKDAGMLSIARGTKTTAEGAYLHHTEVLGLRSSGTWAITVGEANAVGLKSFSQPSDKSPAHGFVDFRELGRRPAEAKGKLLLANARARGRLYPR
jgi:hypothetical protein